MFFTNFNDGEIFCGTTRFAICKNLDLDMTHNIMYFIWALFEGRSTP